PAVLEELDAQVVAPLRELDRPANLSVHVEPVVVDDRLPVDREPRPIVAPELEDVAPRDRRLDLPHPARREAVGLERQREAEVLAEADPRVDALERRHAPVERR